MRKELTYILIFPTLALLVILVYTAYSPHERTTGPFEKVPWPEGATSPPDSLICWEQTLSSQPESGMINTINGLTADGDLLWIATDRGLARLDLRTWTCDLFTQAAGVSLEGRIVLLPDGDGGLWIGQAFRHGDDLGLAFYSDGKWRKAPRLRWESIEALALDQEGQICVYGNQNGRMAPCAQVCSKGTTFPLDWDKVAAPPSDSLIGFNCHLWPRVSAPYGYINFYYTSAAECALVKSHERAAMWRPFILADEDEVWITNRVPPRVDTTVLHQRGAAVRELSGLFPQGSISALAPDPVHGGLWIGTLNGLVYVKIRTIGGYKFQTVPLLLGGTGARGERYVSISQPFPGKVTGLAVDADDQVWAINDESLLRYDEDDWEWRDVFSDTKSSDAIAADPVCGVWVAGQEHLLYFDGVQSWRWPMPVGFRGTPTALLVDRDRAVWMGTTRDGVWTAEAFSRPTGSTLGWHVFGYEQGLENTLITALAQAPDGRIYAAHHSGVSVFADEAAGGRWTTLPGSEVGGDQAWANALTFGRGGDDVWVGYYPGTTVRRYRHADGEWTDYALPDDVREWMNDCPAQYLERGLQPNKGVGALEVDGDGALWVGLAANTWPDIYSPRYDSYHGCRPCAGLWRWPAAGEGDPQWRAMAPETDGPIVLGIVSLAQDAQGRIWVGGQDQIVVWESERQLGGNASVNVR